MQKRFDSRPASGAKAVALDIRKQLVTLRLLELTAVIVSAAFAMWLRIIIAH